MNVLILGLGHVGKALAVRLRAQGHRVAGTTTTPAKVDGLSAVADEVIVLRGSERERVADAAIGRDALILTMAPSVRQARTREERFTSYREVLVESAQSAVAAHPRVIFLSSFSVYADGGPGDGTITEESALVASDEPSTVNYREAERAVLSSRQGVSLRLPDIYGAPGDLSLEGRVKAGLDFMGGRVPFGRDARYFSVHFEDVVDATLHVLDRGLSGAFNVCNDEVLPPTNGEIFDAISDRNGWKRLEFLDQIKAPRRKISAAKLYATGFRVKHEGPTV